MKTWFVAALVAAFGIGQTAMALPVSHKAVEFQLNRIPGAANAQLGTQVVRNKVHVMRALYDYSLVGGSSTGGNLSLKDSDGKQAALPSGAIIKQVLIDVLTDPTAAAQEVPTIALTAQTPGDLKASTAYTSYTGLLAGVPVGSAATMIKLTAARNLYASVHASSLTGGKFNVMIEYYLTD